MDYSVHVLKAGGDVNEKLGDGFSAAEEAQEAFAALHLDKKLALLGPSDELGADGEMLTRPTLLWRRNPGTPWSPHRWVDLRAQGQRVYRFQRRNAGNPQLPSKPGLFVFTTEDEKLNDDLDGHLTSTENLRAGITAQAQRGENRYLLFRVIEDEAERAAVQTAVNDWYDFRKP